MSLIGWIGFGSCEVLACEASVPVRGERNSGRTKNGAKAKRWKEVDGGEEGSVPLTHPLPSTFLLSLHFWRVPSVNPRGPNFVRFVRGTLATQASEVRTWEATRPWPIRVLWYRRLIFIVSYWLHSNQSITSVLSEVFQEYSICCRENETVTGKLSQYVLDGFNRTE